MKVIIPQTFTANMLVRTGFTETVPVWNSSTTYGVDTRVVYPAPFSGGISKIYESVAGIDNLNKVPDDPASLFWVEVQTSNIFAMFDTTVGNQSTSSSSSVTVDLFLPTGISALSLINSEFDSLEVLIFQDSPSGKIYYRKAYKKINPLEFKDWLDYSRYTYVSGDIPISFTDLVNVKNTYLRIIMTPDVETKQVKVGELIFGTLFEFGFTQRGITSGITDYSVKQTDDFGNVNFVERSFSKKFSCRVLIKNSNLNAAQRALYNLRAKPAVWIATEDSSTQESTIIFGYYKDFSAELAYPDYSIYNLEVEGLV